MSRRRRNLAIGLVAAPTRAAARTSVRLWRSPLGAPLHSASQALRDQLSARVEQLQPVAIRTIERGTDAVLASGLPEYLADALVEHAVIERITAVLAEGETLEHVLQILEREQVVRRVLEHPVAGTFVRDLGESEQVGQLVAAVMSNGQVREVLREQSADLAGEVAIEVRSRSGRVDDALEQRVRALLGRPARPTPTVEVPEDGSP